MQWICYSLTREADTRSEVSRSHLFCWALLQESRKKLRDSVTALWVFWKRDLLALEVAKLANDASEGSVAPPTMLFQPSLPPCCGALYFGKKVSREKLRAATACSAAEPSYSLNQWGFLFSSKSVGALNKCKKHGKGIFKGAHTPIHFLP